MTDPAPLRERLIELIDGNPAFMSNVMDENRIWLAKILTDAILAALPTDAVQPVGVSEGDLCPYCGALPGNDKPKDKSGPTIWDGQDYINTIKAHRTQHGSSLAAARNAVDQGWRPAPQPQPVGGVDREAVMNALYMLEGDWRRASPEYVADAILALYATAPTAGSGWVMVPRDDNSRSYSDSLLPREMIDAGCEVQDRVHEDNLNYVAGETTDWDQGMVAVAIYRAMITAASTVGGE